MRSLLVAVLLLNVSAVALAQTPEGESAAQEVRETIEQHRQALLEADTETLDRIWSDDYTFINARGELISKEQRLANIRSGATKIESIEGDEDISIRIYGDMAVGLSNVYLKGQYGGQDSSGQVRAMHVLVKRDGRWQLVANQVTPVGQP